MKKGQILAIIMTVVFLLLIGKLISTRLAWFLLVVILLGGICDYVRKRKKRPKTKDTDANDSSDEEYPEHALDLSKEHHFPSKKEIVGEN